MTIGDVPDGGALDLLRHLVVPAAALALPLAAMFERLQSQAMSEVIGAAVRAGGARARRARGRASSGATR